MAFRLRQRRRRLLIWGTGACAGLGLLAAAADQVWFARPPYPVPHLRTPGAWRPATPPDRGRHAILLSGGIDPGRNHARYWNNVSLIFCALRERGWGDIEVLMSDGRSSEPDQLVRSVLGMFGHGSPVDGPRDLDGDTRDDVGWPATKAALGEVITGVGRRIGPGDELFVFITDHGQLRRKGLGVSAVALLWGDELRGSELDRMLRDAIPPAARVTILAAQCHSKRFLDEVTRPGTVLMASGYPLWIYSDQYYSVFPFEFARALIGRDPISGRASGAPAPGLVEAFRRARDADRAPEWPQFWEIGSPDP